MREDVKVPGSESNGYHSRRNRVLTFLAVSVSLLLYSIDGAIFLKLTYRYGQVCIFAPTSMFLFLK